MLAQILSSQARESIVENIHDYLTSGMITNCVNFHTYRGSVSFRHHFSAATAVTSVCVSSCVRTLKPKDFSLFTKSTWRKPTCQLHIVRFRNTCLHLFFFLFKLKKYHRIRFFCLSSFLSVRSFHSINRFRSLPKSTWR